MVLTVVTVESEHRAQDLLIVGAVMSVIESSTLLVYAEFLQSRAAGPHEARSPLLTHLQWARTMSPALTESLTS